MAINKSNLLDKLCFVVFGSGRDKKSDDMYRKMSDFHQYSGTSLISNQTIRYWFEKNSKPTRQPAFQFIGDFIKSDVDYSSLPPDRKKVFTQIETFLRSTLSVKPINRAPDTIYTSSKGVVIINIGYKSLSNNESTNHHLIGTYRTYRMRLSENTLKPVAVEVLRIFRRNREIRFEHWYKRQGIELSKFEGVIFAVGEVTWFVGSSTDEGNRLRIMHFRSISQESVRYNNLKWGIMTSNINVPSRIDPASCRILMVKELSEIPVYSAFVKDNVRVASFDELKTLDLGANVIERLVRNNNSAISKYNSIDPITDEGSNKNPDMILKVNQSTIENVNDIF